MANGDINIWHYLLQVAPVVLVMGIAVLELWRRNNQLIEKIHERDLKNLETLQQLLSALQDLERQGQHHFDELRKHITERVSDLRRDIQE